MKTSVKLLILNIALAIAIGATIISFLPGKKVYQKQLTIYSTGISVRPSVAELISIDSLLQVAGSKVVNIKATIGATHNDVSGLDSPVSIHKFGVDSFYVKIYRSLTRKECSSAFLFEGKVADALAKACEYAARDMMLAEYRLVSVEIDMN